MPTFSVSRISQLRLWVARRSVGALLLLWLAAYTSLGVLFAFAYKVPDCAVRGPKGSCEHQLSSLLYFSFTTQSTVGYGDYLPQGGGRLLSVAQGFLGLTLNALVLGIAVFKALKRSTPIVFAEHLVYTAEEHHFWFRYINVDTDQLREVDVRIQFVQPKGISDSHIPYDTQTNPVELATRNLTTAIPPFRLFAAKTKSGGGQMPGADDGSFDPLIISPPRLSGSKGEYIEITMRGYYETTGDLFFAAKRYALDSIRCGSFKTGVDNNALLDKSDRAKASYLSSVMDPVASTTAEKCKQCPYHSVCRLDVALKTRGDDHSYTGQMECEGSPGTT